MTSTAPFTRLSSSLMPNETAICWPTIELLLRIRCGITASILLFVPSPSHGLISLVPWDSTASVADLETVAVNSPRILSSTLANLGGAWRGTRLRRVRPSGVLLHPSGTGICGKSGDAREGPSAEVIIAAQDGYKGRLAPAWEMCKARPPTPSEPLQLVYQRGAGCVGSPQNWPKSRTEDVWKSMGL